MKHKALRFLAAAVMALIAVAAPRPVLAQYSYTVTPNWDVTWNVAHLGFGGATICGGSVDARSGASMFKTGFGSIVSPANIPVGAGYTWIGQQANGGPFGAGTLSPYDWSLLGSYQNGSTIVGPGNHIYYFTHSLGNSKWSDTRDPEMLGAVLTFPPTGSPYTIRWKDGTVWTFTNGYYSGVLTSITDPHGAPIIAQIKHVNGTDQVQQVNIDAPVGQPSRMIVYNYYYGTVSSVNIYYNYNTNPGDNPSPLDKVWNFTYTSFNVLWGGTLETLNEVATITDPLGHVSHLNWTTYTRSDGDGLPLLQSITTPLGNTVYSNQYDSSGRVTKQTYADNGYTSISYSASAPGQTGTTTVTDPLGRVTTYACNWLSSNVGYHVDSIADPLGRTTSWALNSSGPFLDGQVTDYRGRVTTLNWDTNKGNLLSKSWTTPLGATATESWSYDPTTSALTGSTDALGRTTTSTVNSMGDTLTLTDARGHMTTITPNSIGEPASVTNALNQTSTMTYDSYGVLLTTTDPLNHTTTRTYDAASRVLTVQDANGKQVSFTYDLMDRLLTRSQVVGGQTLTTTYVYDADGNKTQLTDPKGQVWKWTFDNRDRVATETDPDSKSITYSYDLDSNVSGWTDRAGNSAAFTYDAANRPLTRTFTKVGGAPDSTVTYHYDPTTHLLTSIVDSAAPGNQTWSYTYDSLDRTTAVATPYGTVNIGLDDKINRRDSMQAGLQGTITYGFDNNDNLVSIAQNGATASLTYDALDRLSQQSQPTSPNPVTTAWAFDNAGRVSSVTSTCNGATLDSHGYTRDAVGNITQEVIGGANPSTSTFTYDDLYRLSTATVNGTSYSWVYDQVGNRLSQTAGGVTTNYAFDSADHLTAVNGHAVTSDANGNVTQDDSGGLYSWDVRGRLVGLTKGGSTYAFTYGPDNLRLSKSVNSILTTYLLNGDQVVTDTINGTAYQNPFGPGTDHPLARNGEFFLPNHLSSTTGLTNGNGTLTQSYLYGPFGESLNVPTDSNPFQYTGRENDGDGLLYYRARYYCPSWGRFISADPLGFDGGINPYVYAGNNPVNGTDPSGRFGLAAILVLIPAPEIVVPVVIAVAAAAAVGAVIHYVGDMPSTVVMRSAPPSSGSGGSGSGGSGSGGGGSGGGGSGGTGGAGNGGGGNGGSGAEPGIDLIWRSGRTNPGNLTDPEGLSFRDSLSDPLPPENPVFNKPEYFGIDPNLLPPGSVEYDNIPDGHVTVRGVDAQTLKDAVVVKGKFPAEFPPGW